MILEQLLPQNPFIALTLAAVLGAIIGVERDLRGRASGLRTNMVVSLGSALFTIISGFMAERFGVTGDATRIAAQIVSGIGFLGAGVIIKSGLTVKGLTSAASLWMVAAIGMAAGFSYYTLALFATILGLVSLALLDYVEKGYKKDFYRQLSITGTQSIDIDRIEETLTEAGCRLQSTNYILGANGELRVHFYVKIRVKREHMDKGYQLCKQLQESDSHIKEIRWEKR